MRSWSSFPHFGHPWPTRPPSVTPCPPPAMFLHQFFGPLVPLQPSSGALAARIREIQDHESARKRVQHRINIPCWCRRRPRPGQNAGGIIPTFTRETNDTGEAIGRSGGPRAIAADYSGPARYPNLQRCCQKKKTKKTASFCAALRPSWQAPNNGCAGPEPARLPKNPSKTDLLPASQGPQPLPRLTDGPRQKNAPDPGFSIPYKTAPYGADRRAGRFEAIRRASLRRRRRPPAAGGFIRQPRMAFFCLASERTGCPGAPWVSRVDPRNCSRGSERVSA